MPRRGGPTQSCSETIQKGVRPYYTHGGGELLRQRPMVLIRQRRDDDSGGMEMRVAPFALPPRR